MSAFPDPPTREDFGNAKPFGPGSPLGFELSEDISNANLQELARHVLLRVRNVVIAVRQDSHPNEPTSGSRSEITCSEGGSSGIRLVKDSERKSVYGPDEWIGTGRTQVAGIFVQEGARQKLGSVSGRMICHSVSVVPAECASAIFPFSGIFARWIEHSQSRPKGGQDDGWWTEGFMGVYMNFILNCKRSSGQSWEAILGIDSGAFRSLPATMETRLAPDLAPDPAASVRREGRRTLHHQPSACAYRPAREQMRNHPVSAR